MQLVRGVGFHKKRSNVEQDWSKTGCVSDLVAFWGCILLTSTSKSFQVIMNTSAKLEHLIDAIVAKKSRS